MNPFLPLLILGGVFGLIILISLLRSIRIVPARTALVIERLGKYTKTIEAGFHVLIPFIDKVKYKHNLKEVAVDVPAQSCFTADNVQVNVDGVLYMQVMDPRRASYGIKDYMYATIQLAQTTMRSVIGKLELDRTFEEREAINGEVVKSVDEASDPWGVRVSRYEIQNITVPDAILQAMESQMKAERERRALIARSLGEMESKINYSQASQEEAVNKSEGEKQRRINEAEGRAREILTVARATANGIRKISESLETAGGEDAVALRISEAYISQLSNLSKKGTKVVLPMDLADMQSVMATVKRMIESGETPDK
jgi:regulator of protease activity HflC (stomatin/prohibitin superfamily)